MTRDTKSCFLDAAGQAFRNRVTPFAYEWAVQLRKLFAFSTLSIWNCAVCLGFAG